MSQQKIAMCPACFQIAKDQAAGSRRGEPPPLRRAKRNRMKPCASKNAARSGLRSRVSTGRSAVKTILKTGPGNLILAALCCLVFAGCACFQKTADAAVKLGLSRSDLRLYFGEPLRIERTAAGGEDWYYRFISWRTHPVSEAGTQDDFGEKTAYVSVGWQASRYSGEHPIHVSPGGYVVGPIPNGKVVKE
jgi:hypothetical protein